MNLSQKNLIAIFLGAGLMLSPAAFARDNSEGSSKKVRAPSCDFGNTQPTDARKTQIEKVSMTKQKDMSAQKSHMDKEFK